MNIFEDTIGYAIKIGEAIEVRIVSVSGNQIRVGIEAPKEMSVHRQDVDERILLAKQARAA